MWANGWMVNGGVFHYIWEDRARHSCRGENELRFGHMKLEVLSPMEKRTSIQAKWVAKSK